MIRDLREQQLRRIDRLYSKWEATGEERWLTAAIEADRYYLRLTRAVTA